MLNFDNGQLSHLFRETYHHAMSATLIICPQEGVYLEFQRLGPGKLFPRLNRIYPVGFRGGSTDPGVLAEMYFGGGYSAHTLDTGGAEFFYEISSDERVVVLGTREAFRLVRGPVKWVSVAKLRQFTERLNRMRMVNFPACYDNGERAHWYVAASNLIEEAAFIGCKRARHSDKVEFSHARSALEKLVNIVKTDGSILTVV
ncbi:hypothetical protein [Pantoea vagans]|uniref:hypothetical protein n=1 Tax=Pantoea vagans TaxID=470934 RepID=UPI00366CAEC2